MFPRESRLFDLASTVCSVDDGMAVAGDALEIDVDNADSGSATPANPVDVNAAGAEDVPQADDMSIESEPAELVAGRHGLVSDEEAQTQQVAAPDAKQAAKPAGPPQTQQPAPVAAPDAAAQAAQRQAILSDPVVQQVLQAQMAQIQPVLQRAQLLEQQIPQLQQHIQQQNQMLSGFQQQLQQRQAVAAREATRPQPPPEGASEADILRYENKVALWERDQTTAELRQELKTLQAGYRQQVEAQAREHQKAQQQAVFRQQAAEYDASMQKILSAQDYKFLTDKGMPDVDPATGQPTGQTTSRGQAFFGSLYNQWCQSVADECAQTGQPYKAPDPVLLANEMREWFREAQGLYSPQAAPPPAVRQSQVAQQRTQQQQRTQKLNGAQPMRSQPASAPATGRPTTQREIHAANRGRFFPETHGDKTILNH